MKVIENSVPPCLCVLNNVTMSKGWKYGIGLGVVILLLFAGNLLVGSVSIPPADVFRILLGGEGEKASWSFILWESRLPQALTALLCGGALAVCGLMLQTAFKNPLAGPSILGINAGASLGVAFVMLLFGGSITAASDGKDRVTFHITLPLDSLTTHPVTKIPAIRQADDAPPQQKGTIS